MAHFHEDSDTYHLDQLCLVALSAAFGGVCLSLYFWQRPMLVLLLAPQFYGFILAAGIVLLTLALIRVLVLWKSMGKLQHAHAHDHDCGHEHAHADCVHGNNHDHDWAPLRYVVLLVPVILFLLGLPNKLPPVKAGTASLDIVREVAPGYVALVGAGLNPLQQLAVAGAISADSGEVWDVEFKDLEEKMPDSPESRKEWKDARLRILGHFSPIGKNQHEFRLGRWFIKCCGADARFITMPMISRESLNGLNVAPGDWITVTGRVHFCRLRGGSYSAILIVYSLRGIAPADPDPNFYARY